MPILLVSQEPKPFKGCQGQVDINLFDFIETIFTTLQPSIALFK